VFFSSSSSPNSTLFDLLKDGLEAAAVQRCNSDLINEIWVPTSFNVKSLTNSVLIYFISMDMCDMHTHILSHCPITFYMIVSNKSVDVYFLFLSRSHTTHNTKHYALHTTTTA